MANTLSAAKNARKALRRHETRVSVKSELKTLRKTALDSALEKKPEAEVAAMVKLACKKFGTAASNGFIHKKTAARKIGRLIKKAHKLQTGQLQAI
ncbi:MAG: 30S ribosomal protein S20 [Candidatus Riflebacteria bacterium]|nr:30S ribosomal protein S20 [Candidatus Riflebacteria bacterium]